jgi:hypothetical protein
MHVREGDVDEKRTVLLGCIFHHACRKLRIPGDAEDGSGQSCRAGPEDGWRRPSVAVVQEDHRTLYRCDNGVPSACAVPSRSAGCSRTLVPAINGME